METPKSSDVLALCHQLFPGLAWEIRQDSDDLNVQYQKYSAEIRQWDMCFELLIQVNGSMVWCGLHGHWLIQSRNEQGKTYQQALLGIKSAWVEYCEAMVNVMASQ